MSTLPPDPNNAVHSTSSTETELPWDDSRVAPVLRGAAVDEASISELPSEAGGTIECKAENVGRLTEPWENCSTREEEDHVTDKFEPPGSPGISTFQALVGPAAAAPPPSTTQTSSSVPGIVTRKRSSLNASAQPHNGNAATTATGSGGECQAVAPPNAVGQNFDDTPAPPPEEVAPPKKKKKYTPKPKKTPEPGAVLSQPKPKAEPKPKKAAPSKSTKAKKPAASNASAPKSGSGVGGNPTTAPKSSKSKSKKAPQLKPEQSNQENSAVAGCSQYFPMLATGSQPQPMDLSVQSLQQMPRLTRIPVSQTPGKNSAMEPEKQKSPLPTLVRIKEEPLDLDEKDMFEGCEFVTGEKMAGSSSSRKKKSKGRNGNIYIGVFNRIEWMKLQGAFGFTTVNNFGTFVLEVMRRVHGDIQFWCDLATASGVYPDLSRYEWRNGFPEAINKDGLTFAPELDENMTEEKRAEIVDMGKVLWEQRLEQLKLQQLQREGGAPNVPEEVDLADEEEIKSSHSAHILEGNWQNEAEGYDPATMKEYLEKLVSRRYPPSGGLLQEALRDQNEEPLNPETSASNLERCQNFLNLIGSIDPEQQELMLQRGVAAAAAAALENQGLGDTEDEGNDLMIELEAAAFN